jgi:Tripartite tricarboxylate transporter family receptor
VTWKKSFFRLVTRNVGLLDGNECARGFDIHSGAFPDIGRGSRRACRCARPWHQGPRDLYDKLNFNFIRDIAPVASMLTVPNVMEVNPSFPAKTVPEFIAYAEANPGKINMASSGTGSSIHVSGELFKMMAGVNMVHVPYRGSAPALTDLLAGQVQVMFDPMVSSIEHVMGDLPR